MHGAFRSTLFCSLRRRHRRGEASGLHALPGAHGGRLWGRHGLAHDDAPRTTGHAAAKFGSDYICRQFKCPSASQIGGSTKPAMAVIPVGRRTQEFDPQRLCRCHLPCCSDWEFQYLAKRAQIRITWSNVIRFPKIDTRRADANLFGHFSDR
jgi:hypothetical protein